MVSLIATGTAVYQEPAGGTVAGVYHDSSEGTSLDLWLPADVPGEWESMSKDVSWEAPVGLLAPGRYGQSGIG